MKKCGWILSLLLCISVSFATGPSTMSSLITPIAINDEGDVLCKHYFTENWMGAHSIMPAEISLCLVKDETIQLIGELQRFIPDPAEDWKVDAENQQLFDELFSSIIFSKESPLVNDMYENLIQQTFRAIDLEEYCLDPKFSLISFSEKWGANYAELEQVAVNAKAQPVILEPADLKKKINESEILYQINNQLWLSYIADDGSEYLDSYQNAYLNFYTFPFQYQDMPYDYQRVNSVIFLPEIEANPSMIEP